jgi:EF hand domain-containing protein
MNGKLTLIACALLLMSHIAHAQEPPNPVDEQNAPTAKMTGQERMGMGQGMMGKGMKSQGRSCGMMQSGKMGQGMHMRVMMILMDNDGDGALSLDEVQTAHAKIFKAIDTDEDGKATMAEIGSFFRGGSPSTDQ